MGKWINTEGTDADGRHNCRKPWILRPPFGPGVGALWQCNCGDQWRIVVKELDLPGGHKIVDWERVSPVKLPRDEVLNRVLTVLPAHLSDDDWMQSHIGSDDRARFYAEHVLAALERIHLETWLSGDKVAKNPATP